MEKQDFILDLDGRVALVVYSSVRMQMRLLPPNGASVHRKNAFLCNLDGWVFYYSNGGGRYSSETFAQLRERDPERYERKVEKLYQIRSDFKVSI